jgi:hypothetical protein
MKSALGSLLFLALALSACTNNFKDGSDNSILQKAQHLQDAADKSQQTDSRQWRPHGPQHRAVPMGPFSQDPEDQNQNQGVNVCQVDKTVKKKLLEKDENHVCYVGENETSTDLPEIAFFVGSLENVTSTLGLPLAEFVHYFNSGIAAASAATHRKGCIYLGTLENLNQVSAHPGLQKIIWLGHGTDGDLISVNGDKINPAQIHHFASSQVDQVVFMATQAGKNEPLWKALFSSSLHAKFDLSNENILENNAAKTLIGPYIDALVSTCE